MLVYAKRAAPKQPKKRSRAGCIHCKEKKKKCNEKRPQCDRCTERALQCEYEAVKPRKRRRSSFAGSALSHDSGSPIYYNERWSGEFDQVTENDDDEVQKWENASDYQYAPSDATTLPWEGPFGSDVEEILRMEPVAEASIVRSRSQYPDLAMIAPCPIPSPLQEFGAPHFMEFSPKKNRRALVDHFCNVLSHLIVFKEDTGNPFRQLVLPLSHASSPVMNAIYALSSAHLEYRGVENEEKSLDFHNKALQGLARLIDQKDQASREEVLGAIMLLVYYEVLVQRGNSNIVNGHLKGAMTIMKSFPKASTPTSLFLERAFRFYDVIAALSLGTSPNTTTLPTTTPFPSDFPLSSFTSATPLSAVDTLLGLSTTLWPIIHRLSHLLSFKSSIATALSLGQISKASVLRTELENTSQAIELALTNWEPSLTTAWESEADETRIQSILNNAEAYRHSAFIYLYRTIHSHPRSHPLVQKHTHLSLLACANVVELASQCINGPMSALLWPLFVAACEAVEVRDRELARRAFGGIERRQGMCNIGRAWEIVGEVWMRADLRERVGGDENGEGDWRDVCEERGFSIVFG